jgi:hypothetical protein
MEGDERRRDISDDAGVTLVPRGDTPAGRTAPSAGRRQPMTLIGEQVRTLYIEPIEEMDPESDPGDEWVRDEPSSATLTVVPEPA